MTEAAPRPGAEHGELTAADTKAKVHRAETKTKTALEAKREGPPLDAVRSDHRVRTFIRSANQQTGAIGYTEHGERHANTCADGARFSPVPRAPKARPSSQFSDKDLDGMPSTPARSMRASYASFRSCWRFASWT